ncbi:hypothetical protein HHI31_03795 [Campylobacter fetus subsp. venerealis]|uniref:hypothetical protein n=1 Tax=Campylobacter fetus TaxID=196 RepID=UPI0018E7DC95|nr:hypothetical protein [Campylobacter fetus]QQF51998.1 hypothetical protein HHI31_03795 [Campylobacter fetus subsp. venerealis]
MHTKFKEAGFSDEAANVFKTAYEQKNPQIAAEFLHSKVDTAKKNYIAMQIESKAKNTPKELDQIPKIAEPSNETVQNGIKDLDLNNQSNSNFIKFNVDKNEASQIFQRFNLKTKKPLIRVVRANEIRHALMMLQSKQNVVMSQLLKNYSVNIIQK